MHKAKRQKAQSEMKIPCIVYITTAVITPKIERFWARNMKRSQCDLRIFDDNAFLESVEELGISDVVNAVRPWAFKADIWRYALLARDGGMFFDAELRLYKPPEEIFDLYSNMVQVPTDTNKTCLWQAMLASPPNSNALYRTLARAESNVKARSYGEKDAENAPPLGITGPCTMGSALSPNDYRIIGEHVPPFAKTATGDILSRDLGTIKKQFTNYDIHYDTLWHNRKVYIDDE